MLYPSLFLGALAITTSLREMIFPGERALHHPPEDEKEKKKVRNVPKGSRICGQTQVGRLGLEHCDPHHPPVLMVLERSLYQNYRAMGTQALVI